MAHGVVEDPLHAAVRVADFGAAVKHVVLVGDSFPVPGGGVVGVGMDFLYHVPLYVPGGGTHVAQRVHCHDQGVHGVVDVPGACLGASLPGLVGPYHFGQVAEGIVVPGHLPQEVERTPCKDGHLACS